MKVDIDNLRQHVNEFIASYRIVGTNSPDAVMFSAIYDALNELETRRLASYEQEVLREENRILRADLARITQIKDNLIIAGDRMRDELTGRSETTSFKKWFKNLHSETIESITFNLRKKED